MTESGRVQAVSHFTRQRPLKLIPVVQFYMSEVQQLAPSSTPYYRFGFLQAIRNGQHTS